MYMGSRLLGNLLSSTMPSTPRSPFRFPSQAATGKHFVALVDAARRNAEAADNRLAQTTQEHKALSAAVEDLKKRRDAAKEAYRYDTSLR